MSISRRLTSRVVAILLVPLVLAPGAARGQACGAELTLQEQAALPLPPQFGIDGTLPAAGGATLVWTADGSILLASPAGLHTEQHLPFGHRGLGVTPTAAGYRYLDRDSGTDYLLAPGADAPRAVGELPPGPGEEYDAARRLHDGWIIALRDTAARRFVLRRAGPDGVATLFRSAAADSAKGTPRYEVDVEGDALTLVHLTEPFEVLRVDPAGGRVDTLAVPGHEAAVRSRLPAPAPHWRALPAARLDCGWLVTLADLESDARLLLRYDEAGRLVRVAPLSAPFGIVSGEPATATLLAARRAGRLELVWYRWRWASGPNETR